MTSKEDIDAFYVAMEQGVELADCLVCNRKIPLVNGVTIVSNDGSQEFGLVVKSTGIGVVSGEYRPLVDSRPACAGVEITPKASIHDNNNLVCMACIEEGIKNLPSIVKRLRTAPLSTMQVAGMAFAGSTVGIALTETIWYFIR